MNIHRTQLNLRCIIAANSYKALLLKGWTLVRGLITIKAMIIGVGIDIVNIERIEKLIKRFGSRFIDRIFTKQEQDKANSSGRVFASYAKRFAAKEACAKALGCGVGKKAAWLEMAVTNDIKGRPVMDLTGCALLELNSLIVNKANYKAKIDLSMTDEVQFVQAIVIISQIALINSDLVN